MGEWQIDDQWQKSVDGRIEERWYRWRESPYWLPPNAGNSVGRRTTSSPSQPLRLFFPFPPSVCSVIQPQTYIRSLEGRPLRIIPSGRWIHSRYKGDKETQRRNARTWLAHWINATCDLRSVEPTTGSTGSNLSPRPWHNILTCPRDSRMPLWRDKSIGELSLSALCNPKQRVTYDIQIGSKMIIKSHFSINHNSFWR